MIGNFALLPLRTRTRGPAMQLPALAGDVTELSIDASHESYDPLDETLALFRANTFFRNFEIKGPADRVLIYGILFVSEVIQKIKPQMPRREAEKAVMNLALDTNFAIPGDATFPLNQAFEPPRDRNEAEVLRQYISQMRQELANRLLNRIYAEGDAPSKVRAPIASNALENTEPNPAVVVELHQEKVHGQGPLKHNWSLKAPRSSLQHQPNLLSCQRRALFETSPRESQLQQGLFGEQSSYSRARVWANTLLSIGKRNNHQLHAAMFTF